MLQLQVAALAGVVAVIVAVAGVVWIGFDRERPACSVDDAPGEPPALEILETRCARGGIDAGAFQERRAVLLGQTL